jgi:hypothetical protein
MSEKAGNRRRGPDTMTKAIGIFAGISWLLVLIVFILNTYAKPRVATLFDKRYGVSINQNMDTTLLMYANIALALVVAVCFTGIMINMIRHKRKSDRFSKSLIFFGLGSLIWLIYSLLSS